MNYYERLFWYIISTITGCGCAFGLCLDAHILLLEDMSYATMIPSLVVGGAYVFLNTGWLHPFLQGENIALHPVLAHHIGYCSCVGGTLAVGASILVHLRDPVQGYIYASLICAPLCAFSTLMLLRRVATDFGLFYPSIVLLVSTTYRDYTGRCLWTWIVVVGALVMIWARPILESRFAPDAVDRDE